MTTKPNNREKNSSSVKISVTLYNKLASYIS